MSYQYERYPEQPRNRVRSRLIAITVVVWLLVLGCLAIRFFVRPMLTDYVNRQVAQTINPNLPTSIDPNDALRESLQQVPLDVGIPVGEYEITEQQANDYLFAYRQRLQGIDNVRVRFVPGEVQANVTVQGLTATAYAQPTVRDGRIVAVNQRLGQPLGSILSIDELLGALEDRMNAELTKQGRRVTGIRVEQGITVVTVE